MRSDLNKVTRTLAMREHAELEGEARWLGHQTFDSAVGNVAMTPCDKRPLLTQRMADGMLREYQRDGPNLVTESNSFGCARRRSVDSILSLSYCLFSTLAFWCPTVDRHSYCGATEQFRLIALVTPQMMTQNTISPVATRWGAGHSPRR